MDAFFQWLSGNIIATTTFMFAIGVFVLIFAIAFVQGREISFWPPKIGPKSDNTDKSQKLSKSERYLKFEWSNEIVVDRSRLAEAASIDWMAVSMNKTLKIFEGEIANCLKNGGHIRLLLVDPESITPGILAKLGDKHTSAEDIVFYINDTLNKVIQLHEEDRNYKLEVRYITGQPPHRLMIVNRTLDKGYIRLRWVVTPSARKVPTVVFSKEKDPKLNDFFDFMVEQFEEYWQKAKVVEIDKLSKQHRAKQSM